ncbi:MAG: hypothetical protein CR982_00055 [Candidatus Cloacimonadota bacterium]|nr:MAG: hypothetical protein CR982_00055 [Candidatus Cloacimonadota bacterium]PIE78336.1 MAG: hypothetical protein CSA15_08345 [Candidatus Delongbacteria bacterium]
MNFLAECLKKIGSNFPITRYNKGVKFYREGNIIDCSIEKGSILALILENSGKEYSVSIKLDKTSDIKDRLKSLSPKKLFSIFFSKRVNLISLSKLISFDDFNYSCNCKYKGNCEHIASLVIKVYNEILYYPQLLFTIIGVDKRAIYETLVETDIGLDKDYGLLIDIFNNIKGDKNYFGKINDDPVYFTNSNDLNLEVVWQRVNKKFYNDLKSVKDTVSERVIKFKI